MTSRQLETLPAPSGKPREYLVLAVWVGLLTGLAEVALLGIRKFIFHRFLYLGPQALWMAPVADAALFAIIGGLGGLVVWRWPGRISWKMFLTGLAFVSGYGMLLYLPKLHELSLALLGGGIAYQLARVMTPRAEALVRLARRSLPHLVLFVGVLALGVNGWRTLRDQNALAALAPSTAGAPNVLLITLDTERAASLSLYGYSKVTSPNLDRLAVSSTVFEWAIAPSPWTLPAHASLFTGRPAHRVSADWKTPLDLTSPTLAERLRDRGYRTGGFVANLLYCGYDFGLDRGFIHYDDYVVSPIEFALSSSLGRRLSNSTALRQIAGYRDVAGRKTAADLNRSFFGWLDRSGGRPFFAFINYWDAHEPYLPPEPFGERFGAGRNHRDFSRATLAIRQVTTEDYKRRKMPPEALAEERAAYDASIAYLDQELGSLFAELEKRGLLDSTLLIITADHGEQFGEHDQFVHGNTLYIQLLRVPLLLRLPSRIPAGVRVPEAVSLQDVPATILHLVASGPRDALPGMSLARFWNGSRIPSAPVMSSYRSITTGRPHYSLIVGKHHYIRNETGTEDLFDLDSDPDETRDLAGAADRRDLLFQLRGTLDSELAKVEAQGAPIAPSAR